MGLGRSGGFVCVAQRRRRPKAGGGLVDCVDGESREVVQDRRRASEQEGKQSGRGRTRDYQRQP
jgi:hypothetical protein